MICVYIHVWCHLQKVNKWYVCKYTIYMYMYIKTVYSIQYTWNVACNTSSTAQGGGGSFKIGNPIGEVGCCESRMAGRIHWWTDRWLISLTLSLTIYLPTYLSIFYVSIYVSIYLSLSLFHLITQSIYLSISLSLFHLSICLAVYLSIYLSLSLFHRSICLAV